MPKKNTKILDKACYFCLKDIKHIDYKNTDILENFINAYKKILPRKKTNVCAKHQRKLTSSVKLARIMALLPFTNQASFKKA